MAWKIAKGEDSSWTSIFKTKYINYILFFVCKSKLSEPWERSCILSVENVIVKCACNKVDDGWTINPWKDPWIPWIDGKVAMPKNENIRNGVIHVNDLKEVDSDTWNLDLWNECYSPEMAKATRRIEWPYVDSQVVNQ